MSISVEEFASRCKLNTEEIQALRDILADENIMQMAEYMLLQEKVILLLVGHYQNYPMM